MKKGNWKAVSMRRFLAFFVVLTMLLPLVLAGCTKKDTVEPSFVKSKEDLAKAKIGVQLGTTGDILASDEKENGAVIDEYSKGADAVQALKQGKLDCVIIDEQPAKAFVKVNPGLSILDESYADEEYAICISKKNTELKEKINAALKQIKEDGTLDEIQLNYIGDEKGEHPYKSPDNVDRSNGTLTMATNAAFEPYEYIEDGKIVGFDVDMAQAICDILGMDLVIENIEFDAIINAVQSGKADVGIAGMTVTEDRLKSIDFTDTYTTAKQVIIVRGEEKDATGASFVKSKEDLAKAKIGVQLGTTGDILASDEKENGAVIDEYSKGADAVQALKLGKLDCVIIDEQPAKAFVEVNPGLSILDESYADEEYAICISKKNTELKEKINAALKQIKEDGTLDEIKLNYIGDEKGQHPYKSPDNVDRSNGTLTMATNAAFEPYEYIEDGKITGFDVDMAQAICDILGMDLAIENIEFDAIINAVQSGKADVGIAGMTVTEDRLKSIDFTDTYTTAKQVIIVRNGKNTGVSSFKEKLINNFVTDHRWQYLAKGLGTTLLISFFAVLIGVVLGFLIAIGRSTCDLTGKYRLLNWILKAYLTIIRGTPAMIQLLIIYYVIFASSSINKVVVAVIAFGLNSAAYIAEIVRSGIMSIDVGQFEAGRSLGFNYSQTMWNFILPQAFKNVLPALGNEFIVLLKETSISGYIGIMDLTRGGDYIRSRTYEAFLPLIAVAIIYLVIVMGLSYLVDKLEKKLKTDAR